ncbi:MAG: amino acid adenylation domain-containing protein [Streptomycetaceae bacterium]|nr:amino acid adenylation domain-containing protein [Streptomycetaceae bacterium]
MDGSLLTCADFEDSLRWQDGERLEQLFEDRCDELLRQGHGNQLAVDVGEVTLTYAQLDAKANQLAHFLRARGVCPGDRIGLLFDDAVDSYAGMLAVLKAHAAYVPLDAGFPAERLSYIVSDASVRVVLSLSHLAERVEHLSGGVDLLYLDEVRAQIAAQSEERLDRSVLGDPDDDLCYVIYTSGSTGRPKGVAVEHPAICNFVRVASEVYGLAPNDRVYQGMTIAFDFSVEEIWVPWMVGSTLVPKPSGVSLLGPELDAFLRKQQVTALCCVPTLLATLDEEQSELRFLLVSGESCPQDLIARWHRPERRFLNVYGPTEATVTATWTVLDPKRPVTIGVPLPTYAVVILDPDTDTTLPPGSMGEIAIAGIGLASGYLNRPDLTERAFIHDFIGISNNPSGRIYRTGDLGRINSQGEIEHHGRIDTQVKIRGYRLELTEIESVLLQLPGVAQAVVNTCQLESDVMELCAYYTTRTGTTAVEPEEIYGHLRGRLPAYMVPAYLEQVSVIPTLPSGKADRKSLPMPSGPRQLAAHGDYVPPRTDIERMLAEQLATVLRVDQVSVERHFFDELGASSLLMARFNAAIREHTHLPGVSMKDVYRNPTIRRLAAVVADRARAAEPAGTRQPAEAPAIGTPRYVLCGVLQALAFLCYVCVGSAALDVGANWMADGHGWLAVYERSVAFGSSLLLGIGVVPIAAKWALIGRWKPQRIRVWSLTYFRFWCVKTLVKANPVARLLLGTPLYGWYLRALGAKIGRRAIILTQHVPVCTDLLTIGSDSVIRKDTYLNGYRARDGVIETGTITIGADAFVGEQSILDIDVTMGDAAQLGHSSSLHAGQTVPARKCWYGSPAQPAPDEYDYRRIPAARCGNLRRVLYSTVRLLFALAIVGPVDAIALSLLASRPQLLVKAVTGMVSPWSWTYYGDALAIAAAVVFGLALVGLVVVSSLSRLLSRTVTPGRTYPLYGFRCMLQRTVSRLTNIGFYTTLFGDSSAIVSYLRILGYRLRPVEQTGSNFGLTVKHEMPTLATIGTGTMVSDGLSLMNAEFSSTSFRVSPTTIGRGNFLGNNIAYPPGGRTGDDCLLATKVLVPIGGPIREGVGLLGSPSFEIPRSVNRDHRFDHLKTGPEQQRRLAAKNRHNAVTMGLYLLVRCLYVFGLVLIALLPMSSSRPVACLETAATILFGLAFTIGYFVLVERAILGFRPLRPRFCSIYQASFWRHERYWKVPSPAFAGIFNGTPFKPLLWRLLGVRMGRRVFDDGCFIAERSLTSVGSACTLGAGSVLQGHSLEDGSFKSDHINVGNHCTIGTGAFVHYAVTIDDGAELDADSFLMKGERVPARAHWRGNPAVEVAAGPVGVSATEQAEPTAGALRSASAE